MSLSLSEQSVEQLLNKPRPHEFSQDMIELGLNMFESESDSCLIEGQRTLYAGEIASSPEMQ